MSPPPHLALAHAHQVGRPVLVRVRVRVRVGVRVGVGVRVRVRVRVRRWPGRSSPPGPRAGRRARRAGR